MIPACDYIVCSWFPCGPVSPLRLVRRCPSGATLRAWDRKDWEWEWRQAQGERRDGGRPRGEKPGMHKCRNEITRSTCSSASKSVSSASNSVGGGRAATRPPAVG